MTEGDKGLKILKAWYDTEYAKTIGASFQLKDPDDKIVEHQVVVYGEDGVILVSNPHPENLGVAVSDELNESSLETIEIEIPDELIKLE